jgi:WD40 repeat protein
MLRISTSNDEEKVLVALKSGAVLVYDLLKRSIDFSTEAGHSETIFETEFCKSNSNYLASCSYDGTVRVWDTTTMKLFCVNDTARGTS